MRIATAAEMREIERRASEEFGISAETLMENAGAAVFEVLQDMAPPGSRIAVVCGKGNNGGDGFVVARLAHEAGYSVGMFLTCEPAELNGLPLKKYAEGVDAGVQRISIGQILADGEFDIIVDAVLGTGAKGSVSGEARNTILSLSQVKCPILSIDLPSGLECDSGKVLGCAIRASKTVTLGLPKPFLFDGEGAEYSGDWEVADIGLLEPSLIQTEAQFSLAPDLLPGRSKTSNKGNNGHVLIVAGSRQYRGAAILATLGALKAGAGLVTVAAIESVATAVAAQVPEAIFIVLPEADGVIDGESAAKTLLKGETKFSSAVFGPGLTTAPAVRGFLETLWQNWQVPSVIDADALNLVAQGLVLPNGLNVLTPHPGEAGRLLGSDAKSVQADRFGSARQLVSKYKCPIVLKGAYTVGALPGAPLVVNLTGNPGMATGGMGDVLSGVIATLLSQLPGDPALAGVYGAYWHGLAGDLAAQEIGEIGFSASDLAQFLPRARSILST